MIDQRKQTAMDSTPLDTKRSMRLLGDSDIEPDQFFAFIVDPFGHFFDQLARHETDAAYRGPSGGRFRFPSVLRRFCRASCAKCRQILWS